MNPLCSTTWEVDYHTPYKNCISKKPDILYTQKNGQRYIFIWQFYIYSGMITYLLI